MEAAAAYFRALREQHNLSRERLASDLGTTTVSIWRIEEKDQEPGPALLAGLVHRLQGNWEKVQALLLDSAATADDGRRAARQTEPPPLKPELEAMLRGLPDDDLDAVAAIVARLLERR